MEREEVYHGNRHQSHRRRNNVHHPQQSQGPSKNKHISMLYNIGDDTDPCSTSTSLSPLETDSLNVSSHECSIETEFENSVWLHNVTYDRKKKLAKIDKIFEEFVPAMRTTDINKQFTVNLISMHNRKTNEEKYSHDSSRKGYLLRLSMAEENTLDNAKKLSVNQLLSHFDSLEESFIKFARANSVFKTLCERDQLELLSRNSMLFVQVGND